MKIQPPMFTYFFTKVAENTKLCAAFGVVVSFIRQVAFSIRHNTYSCSLNYIVDLGSVVTQISK